MSVNEDANTVNRKDCTKCPNKGEKDKSLKNVRMTSAKPSSDIRTFLKRTEHQREQVALKKEGDVHSNNELNQT